MASEPETKTYDECVMDFDTVFYHFFQFCENIFFFQHYDRENPVTKKKALREWMEARK